MSSKNEVKKDGKIVIIRVVGMQNKQTIKSMRDAVITQLGKSKSGRYILVDLTKAGRIDPNALRQATSFMKVMPYKRIALFGAKAGILGSLIKITVDAVVDNNKVKVFSSEEYAREWLEKNRTRDLLQKPTRLYHPRTRAALR